jgi:hypothetical protein
MCKLPLDLTGSQDMKKSFQKCAISWGCCVTLRGGRIYTCCIAAHIKFFNNYFKQNLVIGDKMFRKITFLLMRSRDDRGGTGVNIESVG